MKKLALVVSVAVVGVACVSVSTPGQLEDEAVPQIEKFMEMELSARYMRDAGKSADPQRLIALGGGGTVTKFERTSGRGGVARVRVDVQANLIPDVFVYRCHLKLRSGKWNLEGCTPS